MNAAQQLWFRLGLPHAMPKHKNGGPINQGRGQTHKGWALHKLVEHKRKHGYRRARGLLTTPCNGHRP